MKKQAYFVLAFILIMCFTGCNIKNNLFMIFHQAGTSTDSVILTADGDTAMAAKEYSKALEYYSKALQADPNNTNALKGHANALIMSNNLDFTPIASAFLGGDDTEQNGALAIMQIPTTQEGLDDKITATDGIVADMQTLVEVAEYVNDPGTNLNLGIYMSMNTFYNYIGNDFIEYVNDSDPIDFYIIGSSTPYSLSYLNSGIMPQEELDAFKATLDTATIITVTDAAIVVMGIGIDYISKGGANISPAMLDGIINGFNEIKNQLEQLKSKLS